MATEIKMPQLSDTMSSGKILVWKKREGDAIKRGDILAEVETDKANLEIEAFTSGTLLKITVAAGATAKVGEAIGVIGEAGESTTVATPTPAKPSATHAPAATLTSPSPAAQSSSPQPGYNTPTSTSGRTKASPLARKLAAQMNIDIASLQGSGPSGRVVSKDVVAPHATQSVARVSSSPVPEPALRVVSGAGQYTPLSKMRETIARRMQQSVNEAPHFYTTVSINMGEAVRLREVLKGKEEYKGISVNHLVIKAAAYALKNEPRVNCAMRDGQLYDPGSINVGIITAIDDGLLIPVIHQTDTLSLQDLVFEARAAIERARAGRPTSQDLMGGTFSISNMGMFDVDNFTAIINPGQGAVLAVSAVHEEPVAQNGQVVIAPIMRVTLSVDHRIIDGIMSAAFLKHFKQALEVPALLMV